MAYDGHQLARVAPWAGLAVMAWVLTVCAWLAAALPDAAATRWLVAVLSSILSVGLVLLAFMQNRAPMKTVGMRPARAETQLSREGTPSGASSRSDPRRESIAIPFWPPEVAEQLAHGTLRPSRGPVLLSGASEGADTIFGEEALRVGHGVLHVLGPRNEPSDEAAVGQAVHLVAAADELLDGPIVSAAFERAAEARGIAQSAAGDAGLHGTLDDWRDSRRNFLQVRGADVVFAVAYRLNSSPTVPKLDVGGGTGLAVQLYVDRFQPRGPEPAANCRLYMYDDGAPKWGGCLKDPETHRKWNRWDALGECWQPLNSMPVDAVPPLPTSGSSTSTPMVYAGIGGTLLDAAYGVKAIQGLFAGLHEKLSADELSSHRELIHEMFSKLDKDGSGKLDRKEFGAISLELLQRLGFGREDAISARAAMADCMLHLADKDGDGELDLAEFESLALTTALTLRPRRRPKQLSEMAGGTLKRFASKTKGLTLEVVREMSGKNLLSNRKSDSPPSSPNPLDARSATAESALDKI